jgi:hypothetical protein
MGIGAMMEFWAPDVRVVEEVEEEEELMMGIRKMSLGSGTMLMWRARMPHEDSPLYIVRIIA